LSFLGTVYEEDRTALTPKKADKGLDIGAIGHYSATEVGRLAGVSAPRIGAWSRYGIVPTISPVRPKIYSYADAAEAILVHYLIDQGLRARDVRRIVQHLREEYGKWPLTTAPLVHDGKLVVVKEGTDLYYDVGQNVDHRVIAGTLIDLKAVRDALSQGGWVALAKPRPHIQVDPNLHSGVPVVRGRRLATATVAELARTPEGRVLLSDDYALSEDEIAEAVAYEDDLASIAA
jgi:uncharacterized protein (DUF433 family)/DNA-binding transcriptional MerR regulator